MLNHMIQNHYRHDKTEDYAFQRRAIFENLNSKKIKISCNAGNFQLLQDLM